MTNAKHIYKEVSTNPVQNAQGFVFILFAIILLFVVYKFLKGFSKATDFIGDAAGTTIEEKKDIISNANYGDALKWLQGDAWITQFAKSKIYKIEPYLNSKNITTNQVQNSAVAIWDAKVPFYMDAGAVLTAVASMPTKVSISLLAYYFNGFYAKRWNGFSLLAFLSKYLNTKEMQALTEVINKKPLI